MILVWGATTDSPVARVLEELEERGADFHHITDTALATLQYDVVIGSATSGWIESDGRRIGVAELQGMYLRPGESGGGPAQKSAMVLLAVASSSPGVIVNRPAAGRSNASKPYQSSLIAQSGFLVPETLVTTDPSAARAFLRKHGRLVYKSISGIRSIVATLDGNNDSRLDDVCSGPVQLQEYVAGLDVRVHIVGERWFACSVKSAADDYRYAVKGGSTVEMAAFDLPDPIAGQLVKLVREMNLLVAGVDLRLTDDGSWVCFEVNPSPGFPWYEEATGHEIAGAITNLLLGKESRLHSQGTMT